MGCTLAEDQLIAFEPVPISDVFVTGLLPVEDQGGYLRLTFIADRKDGRGGVERVIVSRLIVGRHVFEQFVGSATGRLGGKASSDAH